MTGFAAYNLGCGVGMLLGSLLSRHKQAHREAFIDKSVNLTVLLMFLAYPMMCARILKLYSCRSFSEHSLLAADWSLRCGSEDITRYQAGGAVFLILYVFGIPLFFFYVLYITARPKELPDLPPRQLMELERQNARRLSRYTFLFDIYEPDQWWWELTEMCRKLVMTSAVVFIAPGMSSQIFVSIFISLGFLLLSTFFNPYEDDRLDMLNFVSQLSTVLTLAMMLGGRTNLDADEFLLTSTGFISAVLLVCQLALPARSRSTVSTSRMAPHESLPWWQLFSPADLPIAAIVLAIGFHTEAARIGAVLKDRQTRAAFCATLLTTLLIVPLIAISAVWIVPHVPPEGVIGILTVALLPGGPLANILAVAVGANSELNVTLTVAEMILSTALLPLGLLLRASALPARPRVQGRAGDQPSPLQGRHAR